MKWVLFLLLFSSCSSQIMLISSVNQDVMYDFLDESFEVCERLSCLNQKLRMPLGELGMRLSEPNNESPIPLASFGEIETNTRLIAGGHSEALNLDFILYDLWPSSAAKRLYLIRQTEKQAFECFQYNLPDSVVDYHKMKVHLFGVYPEP